MDLKKVNSLKDKGNKAFSKRNYDEALNFYKEGLDLAEPGDSKIAAILHSNIAQAYVEKKEYPLAVESATESLKLDPSFKKSNFRRAIANTELGNFSDAMKDLRLVLAFEPNNEATKVLMKRCSDKPKMKRGLHETYAKHYMRPILKKVGDQTMGRRSEMPPDMFQIALLRQSFLSTKSLAVANLFFCGTSVGFISARRVLLNVTGWVTCQLMWLKYAVTPIRMVPSDNLFKLLYHLLRPKTFSLVIFGQAPLCNEIISLNKHLDVMLVKECLLSQKVADEDDFDTMKYYSDDLTRLIYIPELAKLTNKKFSKAKTLAFRIDDFITIDFLTLWKKNEWPIESLFFTHGAPDFRAIKQFKQSNGIVSSKVSNVFIRFGKINYEFYQRTYEKLCNDLSTLKKVFPGLSDVTFTHQFKADIQKFPQFAKNLDVIREVLATISTKPEWCTKLNGVIFYEFTVKSLSDVKKFDVKALERTVESLRQKHSDMKIRFRGPKFYNAIWAPSFAAHAVIEFKNKAAQFELAVCYNYSS